MFSFVQFLAGVNFLAGVLGSTWANGSVSTRFHVRVINIPVKIGRLKCIEAWTAVLNYYIEYLLFGHNILNKLSMDCRQIWTCDLV